MATIVLSAAGMAIGGSVGGSVLGLSSAVIGRAVGATLGQALDQRLLGSGSDPVETGRVDRFRLTGASEGGPMAQVYGRMRVSGQVIWASRFREETTTSGGGKGRPSQPQTTDYSYSVSVAIALCEGEIAGVGRVWADGVEMAPDDLNMRVYTGAEDQLPDPAIEAVEGTGAVPAYRGTAYVVLEDLPLGQFGNRLPQLSFEVIRPAPEGAGETDLSQAVKGVALVPGTGEYALATTPVYTGGPGAQVAANINTPAGKADILTSLDDLETSLGACASVSLVVSWFGDDLRCGDCRLQPKVEQQEADGEGMPWAVAGLDRWSAGLVPQEAGRPVYGGTPADAAVLEALAELGARGLGAMFYPFILMEQMQGNGLPDPYGGTEQAHLPWRGRITGSLAPGQPGSPDGAAPAEAEVAAFFGTAQPGDFSIANGAVAYTGPEEWSYRRFILHYAHLCALAGSVDAFCIGSEMVGLTTLRGANGSFPAVAALRQLAADVRAVLGPEVRIGYAADWSEYHGYQPAGTADKLFHLDPLWADDAIDFIGIDNYLPLSDWRDGEDHADAHWGAIWSLDYLRANIEGGEGYDWFYPSPEARAAQLREPITDGEAEPWVWRVKDIRGWWSNYHHNRVDGLRDLTPTVWEPGSKPIWFTEVGCPAVDKGTNQPNTFVDPKSSESALPYFSNGIRDDLIQHQYLRAIHAHYADPGLNPVWPETGVQMVDPARIYAWAWDARPFPAFPGNTALWSDGANHARGHWVNGRGSARTLASVVEEICARSGAAAPDLSQLHGLVRGYGTDDVTTARAALQPLMTAYGFDAIERDGRLIFRSRRARRDAVLETGTMVRDGGGDGVVELTRAQEAEIAGRVRVAFVESDGDYQLRAAEAVMPDATSATVTQSELPLVLTRAEGMRIAERWLAEARMARDAARFSLPPSWLTLGPGDVIDLPDGAGRGRYRIDRADLGLDQGIEAVRIEPSAYSRQDAPEDTLPPRGFVAPVPVDLLLMDLPLITGDEDPVAPRAAATGTPWPGSVALYSADQDAGYGLNTLLSRSALMGTTLTPMAANRAGLFDHGPALVVRLVRGALQGVAPAALLSGANMAAIGDGTGEGWELFQFAEAELVDTDTYALRLRLRGQAGSDGVMPAEWPAGSRFVMLDGAVPQIVLPSAKRGAEQHYRYGPGTRPLSDPAYRYRSETFRGIGCGPTAWPICARCRTAR